MAFTIRGERIYYPATIVSKTGDDYKLYLEDGGKVKAAKKDDLRLLDDDIDDDATAHEPNNDPDPRQQLFAELKKGAKTPANQPPKATEPDAREERLFADLKATTAANQPPKGTEPDAREERLFAEAAAAKAVRRKMTPVPRDTDRRDPPTRSVPRHRSPSPPPIPPTKPSKFETTARRVYTQMPGHLRAIAKHVARTLPRPSPLLITNGHRRTKTAPRPPKAHPSVSDDVPKKKSFLKKTAKQFTKLKKTPSFHRRRVPDDTKEEEPHSPAPKADPQAPGCAV